MGRVAVVIAMVLIVVPSRAHGGGLEIPDNGTRSIGRAGAYAAAVDEPSAIYYNPAAISLIPGFSVTLNANLWLSSLSFQRNPFTAEFIGGLETTIPFTAVETENPLFVAPMIFMTYDFGVEDLGVGLGVYGPSSIGNRSYGGPDLGRLAEIAVSDDSERDWGHGYLMEEQAILLIYYCLALAYNFGPAQFGLTLQVAHLNAEFRNGVDGGGVFSPNADAEEAPSLYSRIRFNADGVAITAIIGLRLQPIDPLTISVSYRPRLAFSAGGKLNVTFPETIADQVSLTSNAALLEVTLPDVLRFGVRWAFMRGGEERADIELDAVYEAWSQTSGFRVRVGGDLSVDFLNQIRNIRPIFIPKGFDNTLSLRLGSDVHVTRDFALRAGVFHEGAASDFFGQGTVRPAYANIDFLPLRRTGVGVGASYTLGESVFSEGNALTFDIGYMHIFSPDLDVDEGEVDLLYPLWVCNDPQTDSDAAACEAREDSPLHAVNEGQYSVDYDLISFGLTFTHW